MPPKYPRRSARVTPGSPFLTHVSIDERRRIEGTHPFELPILAPGILDEPEAVLSPQRQLAFLSILHRLSAPKVAQFIIATHRPLLLAFPGATVLSLDGGTIKEVDYRDTDHYRLTVDFLQAPERFFRHLFHSATESSSSD